MSKLILLIVGAAWLAVLLPPLVRARLNGSPANSVTNFRRQLNHLESAGGRYPQQQLRGMARPLAPTQQRPAGRAQRPAAYGSMTGALVRQSSTRPQYRPQNVSPAAMQRQKRQNLVFGLAGISIASLLLGVATGSSAFVYTFILSLLALVGYCYVLVQMRVKRDNERYLSQFRRTY
jgi:Flp pilus assembly protein TadB